MSIYKQVMLTATLSILFISLSACSKNTSENLAASQDIATQAVADVMPDIKQDVTPNVNTETERNEILAIIEAVRMGWLEADGTPFRNHFLDFDGARYFETGGQNIGLTDLVEHHVEPEGDAFTDFVLDFSNIQTHIEGDFAWALVDVKLNATLKRDGRVIDNKGHQTFIFKRLEGKWTVLHTHSSSRAVKKK